MPHRAVEIDALPRMQRHRSVELQVHLDRAFENENELLALVPQRLPELLDVVSPDAREDRHHAFLAQIGAQVLIVIVRRRDLDGVAATGDTTARSEHARCCSNGGRFSLRQKLR
jgi:hypothetical protein